MLTLLPGPPHTFPPHCFSYEKRPWSSLWHPACTSGPKEEQGWALCHGPCPWFLGPGKVVTPLRKQSAWAPGQSPPESNPDRNKHRNKQLSEHLVSVQKCRLPGPVECSLFPFGFPSRFHNLHLFKSDCASFAPRHQVGLSPSPPLRWQTSQRAGPCLFFPSIPLYSVQVVSYLC